jgi:hypothetical protein
MNMMNPFSMTATRNLAGLCLLFLSGSAVSCAAPDAAKESSKTSLPTNATSQVALALPLPWTSKFRESGVLIADSILIEGPLGLLDHVATRSVEEFHSYKAETLPSGFQQTYRVRAAGQGVEIRAYLDALKIVALRELIVIEKPGELDVHVRAQGDAYWQDPATLEEQRRFEINLVGPIDRGQ